MYFHYISANWLLGLIYRVLIISEILNLFVTGYISILNNLSSFNRKAQFIVIENDKFCLKDPPALLACI